MRTSELIKELKKAGCTLIGHGGEHDIWFSNLTGKTFMVPRHSAKEIAKGTENQIRKMAGLK